MGKKRPVLRWARQQVGFYVAFDERGNSVGYVFNRGPGAWSAQVNGEGYRACESLGKAKAAVRELTGNTGQLVASGPRPERDDPRAR